MSEVAEGDVFEFTPENLARCQDLLTRYPTKQAAMLPVLHVAQEQHGFVSTSVEKTVARLLDVPEVAVHQVVTFYTLYNRRPVGKHQIRVCMSPSCWLRGAEAIKGHLEEALGVPSGGTTDDGRVTWWAVSDCLGACEDAPMMMLDKDFYDCLTPEKVDSILKEKAS